MSPEVETLFPQGMRLPALGCPYRVPREDGEQISKANGLVAKVQLTSLQCIAFDLTAGVATRLQVARVIAAMPRVS